MNNLWNRSVGPFDEAAVQRHRHMGLLDCNGDVNADAVNFLAHLCAGLFIDALCDSYVEMQTVSRICQAFCKSENVEAQRVVLMICSEYETAIKVYCPPGVEPPLYAFIDALDGKLKAKLLWQIFRLRNLPACELKEPHFKHFSLERYSQMYELREKGKVLIRIVFTVQNEDVILLTSFIKRQPRDTKKALDQSLYILSDIQQHPDRTSNFDFQREATA